MGLSAIKSKNLPSTPHQQRDLGTPYHPEPSECLSFCSRATFLKPRGLVYTIWGRLRKFLEARFYEIVDGNDGKTSGIIATCCFYYVFVFRLGWMLPTFRYYFSRYP
jgi:hypothetical protein